MKTAAAIFLLVGLFAGPAPSAVAKQKATAKKSVKKASTAKKSVKRAPTAASPEKEEPPKENFKMRCGWLDNPSEGTWSFEDSQGQWTISELGGYEAKGIDKLPRIEEQEMEFTNSGGFGYGCACLDASVDETERRLLTIRSGKPLPLKQCKTDKTLPLKASGV